MVSLYYRARPAREQESAGSQIKIDHDFALYFISHTISLSSDGKNFVSEEGFKIGKCVIIYNLPVIETHNEEKCV